MTYEFKGFKPVIKTTAFVHETAVVIGNVHIGERVYVGPGAVTEIRVEHPSRGNCRQCHVPDTDTALFER